MSKSDYSAALRSLDSALSLVHKGHASRPDVLRLRIRRLALQLELLRARMRQPIVPLDRN